MKRTILKIRIALSILLLVMLCVALLPAQSTKEAMNVIPTGKGYGQDSENGPEKVPYERTSTGTVTNGNGISYHGGPVMTAARVNVYFIWYGDWTNGARASDSQNTVNLLTALFSSTGLNNSGYEKINTTYGNASANVSGSLVHSTSINDNYSQGKRLRDSSVRSVVANAINSGQLPSDANGLYFVLTSSDVTETSGFCTKYCGWHTNGSIGGNDIKYSFVGNPDRCPSACEWQTTSPNNDSGADGMASIMAHESEEAISDPDLNAWYDASGAENADKCAWKFGATSRASNGSIYNQTLGGYNWLIQMNWENARGGGCDNKLGGAFYSN